MLPFIASANSAGTHEGPCNTYISVGLVLFPCGLCKDDLAHRSRVRSPTVPSFPDRLRTPLFGICLLVPFSALDFTLPAATLFTIGLSIDSAFTPPSSYAVKTLHDCIVEVMGTNSCLPETHVVLLVSDTLHALSYGVLAMHTALTWACSGLLVPTIRFGVRIPYPSDLGVWSRQKNGMFKDKMRMDDTTFKALQTSVRTVASKKFDKSKTARSQPPEVMQAIKDEMRLRETSF
ncbi:hypothetical protein K488DRAFT_74496 [Vararia minispora EC-137]|uniref:Uncharacterized protein n=1 Tax=Vararia minispora EC-137 TaxID=1314806 RepID=A0ACB8Q6P9_9AGAM|nr:hypothetical protein K488DRAFT_74496 [Vararia minispora EC-137]